MKNGVALLALLALPAFAQRGVTTYQANVSGSGNSGKCTIEVNVDGVAEVSINGSQGRMRTLEGQPARWVRFQCNAPFPQQMSDFRFRGIDGRGRQTLLQDPRNNRGNAVIRIEDPNGGSEGYTFDLEWSGGSGGSSGGGGGRWDNNGGSNSDRREAIRLCREEVRNRAERDYNLSNIRINDIDMDNGRGRRDNVSGSLEGRRRGGRDRTERYSFDCEVNPSNGRVRSVNLRPQR